MSLTKQELDQLKEDVKQGRISLERAMAYKSHIHQSDNEDARLIFGCFGIIAVCILAFLIMYFTGELS